LAKSPAEKYNNINNIIDNETMKLKKIDCQSLTTIGGATAEGGGGITGPLLFTVGGIGVKG
jgi:hypothetical protein